MRKNYLALSTEIPLHYHMNRIPQDGSDDEEDQPMEDETEPLIPAAEEETNDEEGQSSQKKNKSRKRKRRNAIKRNPTNLEICLFWCDRWTCAALRYLCGNCKDGCMQICGSCKLDDCGDCNCC